MRSGSVVLITVDCLRADHLGCYGYDRPTSPNIDTFAEGGTVFDHGYANCPGTRWAFQSLHTGVSTLHFEGLGIPEGYTPLAQRFSDSGYRTGGFANNGFVSREYRYDTGFDTYYSTTDAANRSGTLKRVGKKLDTVLGSQLVRERLLLPLHDRLRQSGTGTDDRFRPVHSDSDTVDRALSFVEGVGDDPYFLWVHLMDAHTPYGYWPDHLEAIRGDAEIEHTTHPGQEGKITVGEEPPDAVIDTYDAGVRSADEQIGRLLDAVSSEATVVVTGDHGEEFGRYNGFHQASLYSSMTQVPIVLRTPGSGSGRSGMPAQHLDIPPTLLRAAGIEIPKHWEGEPLQTLDRPQDHPIFFTLGPDEIALRMGDWKYIETGGNGELYRVPHSGSETEPVVDPERTETMRDLVQRYRTETEDLGTGRPELGEGEISGDVEDQLEELGYL
jgi:arylsulfatase A-like enzyme